MGKIAIAWVLAWGVAGVVHAGPLGTVTIADGRAHLARGLGVYAPAEGVTVEEGDLLELEDGALLQIELTDGSILSFSARAQALLPAASDGKAGDLKLASGWSKLNLASAAEVAALSTAQVRVVGQSAVYVLSAGGEGTQMFVESGELVPVFAATRAGQPAVLKGGDFVGVSPDAGVSLARRPPPGFVTAMPKVYLDKLPVRLPRLKVRGVAPRRERDAGFGDLDAWVKRYPSARAALLAQFAPLLKDKGFVRQLEPALKDYPEWELVVHPKKPHGAKDKAPKAKASETQ